MPSLLPELANVYAYYRLAFLPDGFPGRRVDGAIIPHPIYGPYIIQDYLEQYASSNDPQFLAGARTVADAALARMTRFRNSLVFYYPKGLASIPGHYYSGLTQARYVDMFSRLADATGSRLYRQAAKGAFASLMIAENDGGVMRDVAGGCIIQEWPHEIPTFTLNGWLSAIEIVAAYVKANQEPEAQAFLDCNLDALEALLPLYDVPALANTRYQLTGAVKMRLVGTGASVTSGAVEVPGEGRFAFAGASSNSWRNHILAASSRSTLLNIVLSRVSYPQPNRLHLSIDATAAGSATLEIATGPYSPLATSVAAQEWIPVAQVELDRGANRIDVAIPWVAAELVAYPTNFLKKIGGRYFNSYHFIHVKELRALYALTGRAVFKDYADKWQDYIARWPSMPVYRDAGVSLVARGS